MNKNPIVVNVLLAVICVVLVLVNILWAADAKNQPQVVSDFLFGCLFSVFAYIHIRTTIATIISNRKAKNAKPEE